MQMEDTPWMLRVFIWLISLSIYRSKHLHSFSLERKISGFLFLMACRYLIVLLYLCMGERRSLLYFQLIEIFICGISLLFFNMQRMRGIKNRFWLQGFPLLFDNGGIFSLVLFGCIICICWVLYYFSCI